MVKHLTHEDVVERLRSVTQESSMTAVANEIGVSLPYISEILRGRRPLGPRVIDYLGYEKQVVFQRKTA
jgi:hypothetical protein